MPTMDAFKTSQQPLVAFLYFLPVILKAFEILTKAAASGAVKIHYTLGIVKAAVEQRAMRS